MPNWAALFVCLSLSTHQAIGACSPERIDGQQRVVGVFDGDTVKLEGGRNLRIIGLNAPEMSQDEKPPQPFAVEAKRALQEMLSKHDYDVLVQYDQQRWDRYGRLLAHLYLPDHSNISAQLLGQGLGVALTVTPNTWNVECYWEAEARARARNVGIWSLPGYQVIEASALPRTARGYRRVKGKVVRVSRSTRSTWLNLEGPVALRIDHTDRGNFAHLDLVAFKGKSIVASGWLYRRNGELRMRVRHPAALSVIRSDALR